MKRIVWGRVMGALVGVPMIGLMGWLATMPATSVVQRRAIGPDDCQAEEVLAGGALLHREHEEPEGSVEVDQHAAMVVVSAARCARMEGLHQGELFPVFETVYHGVAWIAEHEPAPIAVEQLLDVWELAADQRRVSGLIAAGVWTAVGLDVAEKLPDLLADPSLTPGDRRLAAARLRSLASAPVDWDEVAAREEREVLSAATRAAVTPARWSAELLATPWWLVQARWLSFPIVTDFREGHRAGEGSGPPARRARDVAVAVGCGCSTISRCRSTGNSVDTRRLLPDGSQQLVCQFALADEFEVFRAGASCSPPGPSQPRRYGPMPAAPRLARATRAGATSRRGRGVSASEVSRQPRRGTAARVRTCHLRGETARSCCRRWLAPRDRRSVPCRARPSASRWRPPHSLEAADRVAWRPRPTVRSTDPRRNGRAPAPPRRSQTLLRRSRTPLPQPPRSPDLVATNPPDRAMLATARMLPTPHLQLP